MPSKKKEGRRRSTKEYGSMTLRQFSAIVYNQTSVHLQRKSTENRQRVQEGTGLKD
jgi:hypothetical protein